MLNAKVLSQVSIALSASAFLAFTWFGHLANAAMSKSGVGDVSKFQHYSSFAGVAFWTTAAAWVAAVAFTQASPQPYRGRALFVVGLLVPASFFAVYIGLLTL